MVSGLNNQTGETVTGWDHLLQSVRDILSTPIGSRVMRRTYGSRVPALLDAPINQFTIAALIAAMAEALAQWEPRITLKRVRIFEVSPGRLTADMDIVYDGVSNVLEAVI